MRAPTLREMDISLSLRMMTMGVWDWPIWLSASKAMPPAKDASPMTRHDLLPVVPAESRASAKP